MKYVLIMVFMSGSGGFTSFTQEFTSKKSCTVAMNQIIMDILLDLLIVLRNECGG